MKPLINEYILVYHSSILLEELWILYASTALRAGQYSLHTVVGPILFLIDGQDVLAHLVDSTYFCISIQNTT